MPIHERMAKFMRGLKRCKIILPWRLERELHLILKELKR